MSYLSSFLRVNSIIGKHSSRFLQRSAYLLDSSKLSGATHKVNNLEKKFLVWTGKFKTVEEIPTYVAPEVMEKARSKMRIRISNIMMGATLLACLGMAISGKRAHQQGDSVHKQNQEWHNQVNKEAAGKETAS